MNKISIKGNIIEIKLTQNQKTIIDKEDWNKIKKINWHSAYDPTTKCFRVQGDIKKKNKWKTVHLARIIMNVNNSLLEIDHINNNPLDNTKNNLRVCFGKDNKKNKRISKNNTSGFKGVNKFGNKYICRIGIDGKRIFLGYFENKELAAKRYNIAAIKYHGEFAKLNKI
jgi:hypothetical protein